MTKKVREKKSVSDDIKIPREEIPYFCAAFVEKLLRPLIYNETVLENAFWSTWSLWKATADAANATNSERGKRDWR